MLDLPLALDLLVSALVGLAVGVEREWSGHTTGPDGRFAGIRTFTLLGVIGGFGGWFFREGQPALAAVMDGRMHATVRNPSCRIHGGAIMAGVAAVVAGERTGQEGIPKHVITDGPVVTRENAAGMAWMQKHFLI